MKLTLQITKIEDKKNTVYFNMNGDDYYLNTKTDFIYKSDRNGKYTYVSNFDIKIKKMVKDLTSSFKKYKNKIEEK